MQKRWRSWTAQEEELTRQVVDVRWMDMNTAIQEVQETLADKGFVRYGFEMWSPCILRMGTL
jgi:hypothetical protein